MFRATFPATTRNSSLLNGSVSRGRAQWKEFGGRIRSDIRIILSGGRRCDLADNEFSCAASKISNGHSPLCTSLAITTSLKTPQTLLRCLGNGSCEEAEVKAHS